MYTDAHVHAREGKCNLQGYIHVHVQYTSPAVGKIHAWIDNNIQKRIIQIRTVFMTKATTSRGGHTEIIISSIYCLRVLNCSSPVTAAMIRSLHKNIKKTSLTKHEIDR